MKDLPQIQAINGVKCRIAALVKLRNGDNWQDAEICDVSQREDIYSEDGVDQWRRNEINIAGTRRGPKGRQLERASRE